MIQLVMQNSLPEGSVLLVSEPITPSGIAVYIRSIATGLSEAGIPHPIITSTIPAHGLLPDEEISNVQPISGLFWSFWRPFIFRKLVNWARENEPILIHGLSAVTAPVCSRLSQALNIPFVLTVHHFQNQGRLRAEKGCAAIIAVSEYLRENLVNDAGIPKELVRLIPAGIRVPRELQPRPATYQHGENASIPLVSTFGKLIERKDFPTFLRAARVIVDRIGPECSFVISGDGPDETMLRALAHELKIDKLVTFCHGTAANEDLLRDTDVYVQCSITEGFGTMVLQAMAHGVPVVAASTGGIIALVKDGENGFLVRVGDHEALATRILNLLNDPDLSHRFGEAGRETAATHFSLESMMASTRELYAEVLAQQPISAEK